ncbi:MAG: alpha/beta hydrolase family protein, partial [Bacillota bacterium]|nr:alpha/beta hydrolase family protein [Bacillota bacterium]
MKIEQAPAVLTAHHDYARLHPPSMAFDPDGDFGAQQQAMRIKYMELVNPPAKTADPTPVIEFTHQDDPRFDEIRFYFASEPDLMIPAHLLLPKGSLEQGRKIPVVICLQGHSTGMHISLGREKYEGDHLSISGGDRDFAIQAVSRGYAAIAMEQRGFGELDGTVSTGVHRCQQPSMQALMLGRTLIGERASDVSRLIDAMSAFPQCDTSRVGLMGNSGGGTATFYTACLEPRIQVAMPSCSFCSLHDSIFSLHHCVCNYIPGLYRFFEMGDLALLIAPRPLIVVCGRDDTIFPLPGVQREFAKVRQIYDAAGVPDRCRLIVGEGGHRFYAEQ